MIWNKRVQRTPFVAAVFWLVFTNASHSQQERTPETIIQRAIAAMGGKKKLVELERTYTKMNLVISGTAGRIVAVSESWEDNANSRKKSVFRFNSNGQSIEMMLIVNENGQWQTVNGKTRKMDDSEVEEHDSLWEATVLYPLLEKESRYRLTYKGDREVDKRVIDCVGVTAADESSTIDLFFDRAEGVLVKYAVDAVTGKARGKRVERHFRDYKDFDGLKIASKTLLYMDGKLFSEDDIVEMRRVKTFPSNIFANP